MGQEGKPEGSRAVFNRPGRRVRSTHGGGEGSLPSTLRIKTPVVSHAHSEHCADINHSAGEDIYCRGKMFMYVKRQVAK